MHTPFLAIAMPGPVDWIVIALLGLLFFGKRLPEVGRSIGKTIVEFKKGMREVENDLHEEEARASLPPQQPRPAIQQQPNQGYKFDPYTGKPIEQETASTGSRNDPPAA